MRRALLHFLLFSFLFNAALGLPLHAAEHTRGLAARYLLEPGPADRAPGAEAPATDDAHEVHTICALCATLAQQGNALRRSVPPDLAPAEPLASRTPQNAIAFVPATERWPFASRDPPL